MELVRAVTLTWLFAGLRSDEIARLRVGCIRWQHDGTPIAGDAADVLAADAVCLLDVPVHKTGTAFTKPVDPLLGQAIEAWQARASRRSRRCSTARPASTSTCCSPSARTRSPGTTSTAPIIPALCRKAGVPATDVRGKITSHRARSTIASQLYNAKEPMTLFELQAWLGHRTPATTQHYAKITPNTLAKAYNDAGYFARNVRTIEVLVDRDAVTTGAAAAGQPWQHYDLGHGYCSYSFFEQCPHRMACARCDFYTPKDSTKAQLLRSQGQPAAHARHHPAHRRRTRRRRRRTGRPRPPPRTPRRRPNPGRTHPTPDRHTPTATPLPIVAVNHGRSART